MVTPSKSPPPCEQLLPLPTPCFKMFWKDPLMTPHPHHPFQASFTATPTPSTTPSPLKILIIHKGVENRFDPPANSETKEARTMKLCTVIAYYITSITKQFKFPNFHCSIVCSYCSFVCFITKSDLESDQFFMFSKLNEIHVVDSPFNEDSKNIIFFHGGPNFGGGTAGKSWENGQ